MKLRGILYYSALAGHTAHEESQAGRRLALACVEALRDTQAGAAAVDPGLFEFPPRGKPRLAGGPDFSISHSAPLVACAAVSRGEVGLDVECDASIGRLTLATICDEAERDMVRAMGALHVWIAKEAALKAGGGTIEHIGAVRVFAGGASFRGAHFHAQRLELAGRWPACVMTSEPGVPFEVRCL